MNFVTVFTQGGGMFSLFHMALERLLYSFSGKYDTITGFKIIIPPDHYIKDMNMFDVLFDYTDIDTSITVRADNSRTHFLKAYTSPYYDDLRTILSKNKINPAIKNRVELYKQQFEINENTLAIHIRLTDMNIHHACDYGIHSFDNYCDKLNEVLKKNPNIDSIYVCSDNTKSIQKMRELYSDKYKIHYIQDTIRVSEENIDSMLIVTKQYNDEPHMAEKLFIELLVASSCSYFIYRISDFANFAILYSNTFKEIECLN